MEPQRKHIVRRMMVLIFILILLIVLRLATLDGVSQSRSSSLPASISTVPGFSTYCNILPAEDQALKYAAILSIEVRSVNQQGSFIGTVPTGFLANGQTNAAFEAKQTILATIKPGEYLQVALAPRSPSEFTALEVKPIDQQTYSTCQPYAIYFTTQAQQISARQVIYWENASQVLFFDPQQFPVSIDRSVQVIVQFNATGSAVVLQAYNV
jgi:hypothetical protein